MRLGDDRECSNLEDRRGWRGYAVNKRRGQIQTCCREFLQ